MKLEGKVAIITGGASGIGEATARCFAEHGANAIVIADIQDEKGQAIAVSIGNNRCKYMHCDVSSEQQVQNLVEEVVQDHGKLHIMFSNAGIFSTSDQVILDYDVQAADKLFAVNMRGMAACVKHAARVMVEKGNKGSIICTASIAGHVGWDGYTDYVMSKHAVLGLMRAASRQLGKHGIRVNCVSPGLLATPMVCRRFEVAEDEVERLADTTKWLKGTGKVEHVAKAVLFLASNDSEFVTGHDLAVDGGWSGYSPF